MHATYREKLLLYRDREYMTEMGNTLHKEFLQGQDVMHEYSYKMFSTNIHQFNMQRHCTNQHYFTLKMHRHGDK